MDMNKNNNTMEKKFEGGHGHKAPFTVPEDYFDNFTDHMMNKIQAETKNGDVYLSGNNDTKKERKSSLIRIIKPAFALVAMVGFAFFFVNIIFPLVVNDNDKIIGRNSTTFSRESNTITASSTGDSFQFDSDFNPTDEEIADYLSANVDDIEEFYNDL